MRKFAPIGYSVSKLTNEIEIYVNIDKIRSSRQFCKRDRRRRRWLLVLFVELYFLLDAPEEARLVVSGTV